MRFFSFRRGPEPITILLPCKDQKQEYFMDAVMSVVRQTSADWRLLIVTDPDSPSAIADWSAFFGDPRVRVVPCPRHGFAQALNHGLQEAETAFVSILLSDDRYSRHAIRTLQAYRKRFPAVDFFHSARRHIDHKGDYWGDVMPARTRFRIEDFHTSGSPVKHLLCWRREMALAIGGMLESLSVHGCDDYDFPWRMAERGAKFQAVKECLYEYRLHHTHDRLTTAVPITRQLAAIRSMFERHGISARDTDRYLQRARDGYLIAEFTDQIDRDRGAQLFVRCFRESESAENFLSAGFKQRYWFPHRIYCLPKGGPDGLKLANRMTGRREPERMREFVLYARTPVVARFPREIFYDNDLQWHQQQFGIDGQIACANVLHEGSALRCYLIVSDIVQRVSRLPKFRTQIDNRFHGWNRLLLNAILLHAAENNVPLVYLAGANLVLRNTDRRRNSKPPLFERIYDDVPRELDGVREGDWWRLDVNKLSGRIARLERGYEIDDWGKTICILHDTERGLGHSVSDPGFAAQADTGSLRALQCMLEVEARMDVRATYSVVGLLMGETREAIERGGHAIAFHSYDHRIAGHADAAIEQFRQCRDLDYRLKGYRLPQSKMIPGITDADFAEWNFEWVASSAYSLGCEIPVICNGVVKIPVHADDYAMFREGVPFEAWQRKMLAMADAQDFLVIGLHDCYAHLWLPQYEAFLRELQKRASLITLDEVAARLTLGRSRWFEME